MGNERDRKKGRAIAVVIAQGRDQERDFARGPEVCCGLHGEAARARKVDGSTDRTLGLGEIFVAGGTATVSSRVVRAEEIAYHGGRSAAEAIDRVTL